MKNISRRTFIKGMAVAAAATAASSVLAGCNLVPTQPETPVEGFKGETKTLDLGDDKVITLTTTGLSTLYDKAVKVDFTVVNETGKDIYFSNTPAGSNAYNVYANAYFDGKHDAEAPVNGADKLYGPYKANSESATSGITASYTHKGSMYFNTPETWSTMTLVVYVNDKEVQFNLSK